MNTKRTLRLRKEVLTELRDSELELVIGAATVPTVERTACNTCSCVTCPEANCTTVIVTLRCG